MFDIGGVFFSMRMAFVIPLLISTFVTLSPAQQVAVDMMPLPTEYKLGRGALKFDESFSVSLSGYKEDRLFRAVERLLTNASKQTGIPLQAKLTGRRMATLTVHTEHGSKPVEEPDEDESYSLEVDASGARLSAATPLGAMHGLQTFLQLIAAGPGGFHVPAISIHDRPRFSWRGLLIDVSRHFMPVEVLRRNLDGMEAVKLNVFHWHLSDDQGFRVESRKFPKLTGMGSDGLYYTQQQVRDLVAYARDRGIRVIPEFDMPGHTTSWFVGYPELSSGPGPYQIERRWGVFDPAIDPTRDHTYKFLDDFIGEMSKLFPDHYFHIGGDEVNGKQWAANGRIQSFMRQHGIENTQQLQTYFTHRLQKLVSKHHKAMVGWDEILSPDIPKAIVIQSWRGQDSLASAAQQGYGGILSSGYYVDLNWPAGRHYAVDPLSGAAAHLSRQEKQKIFGGEAAMWSEYVDPENVDSRIWPRTAAIAERLWSPENVTDPQSMYTRMYQLSWRLDFFALTHNTNYLPMLERIAAGRDAASLRTLADVVEPVKDYAREELALTPATQLTPLNRLVDAARPESETARLFSRTADQFLAGRCQDAALALELRALLENWRKVGQVLEARSADSSLLREVAPVSGGLATIATAGIAALDAIGRHEPASAERLAAQAASIQAAQKPTSAQLLLPLAVPIQKLVEAGGNACSGR